MSANLALGLFTTGVKLFGAGEQSKHEKEMIELEYKSDLEDIRRREFEQQQIRGTAKALSEASGVLHSGGSSAQGYLDTMDFQFKKEIDFMKAYAEEARRLGREGVSLRKTANILGAFSSGMSIYNSGGK